MEPRETYPFFETASIWGAITAVVASLVFYGVMIVTDGSLAGLIAACLGCCGIIFLPGLITTKMHISSTGKSLEVGRGALIGLTAGVIFGVVFSFMGIIWEQFVGNVNDMFFKALEDFMLEHGDPGDADDLQEMREMAGDGGFTLGGFIMNIIVYGILNMITGMIGSSVFKGTDDE